MKNLFFNLREVDITIINDPISKNNSQNSLSLLLARGTTLLPINIKFFLSLVRYQIYHQILKTEEDSITHPFQQEVDLWSAVNMDALEIQFASHQQNLIHQ